MTTSAMKTLRRLVLCALTLSLFLAIILPVWADETWPCGCNPDHMAATDPGNSNPATNGTLKVTANVNVQYSPLETASRSSLDGSQLTVYLRYRAGMVVYISASGASDIDYCTTNSPATPLTTNVGVTGRVTGSPPSGWSSAGSGSSSMTITAPAAGVDGAGVFNGQVQAIESGSCNVADSSSASVTVTIHFVNFDPDLALSPKDSGFSVPDPSWDDSLVWTGPAVGPTQSGATLAWPQIANLFPAGVNYGTITGIARRTHASHPSDTPVDITISHSVVIFEFVWDSPDSGDPARKVGTMIDWTAHVEPSAILQGAQYAIEWEFEGDSGHTVPSDSDTLSGGVAKAWQDVILAAYPEVTVTGSVEVTLVGEAGSGNGPHEVELTIATELTQLGAQARFGGEYSSVVVDRPMAPPPHQPITMYAPFSGNSVLEFWAFGEDPADWGLQWGGLSSGWILLDNTDSYALIGVSSPGAMSATAYQNNFASSSTIPMTVYIVDLDGPSYSPTGEDITFQTEGVQGWPETWEFRLTADGDGGGESSWHTFSGPTLSWSGDILPAVASDPNINGFPFGEVEVRASRTTGAPVNFSCTHSVTVFDLEWDNPNDLQYSGHYWDQPVFTVGNPFDWQVHAVPSAVSAGEIHWIFTGTNTLPAGDSRIGSVSETFTSTPQDEGPIEMEVALEVTEVGGGGGNGAVIDSRGGTARCPRLGATVYYGEQPTAWYIWKADWEESTSLTLYAPFATDQTLIHLTANAEAPGVPAVFVDSFPTATPPGETPWSQLDSNGQSHVRVQGGYPGTLQAHAQSTSPSAECVKQMSLTVHLVDLDGERYSPASQEITFQEVPIAWSDERVWEVKVNEQWYTVTGQTGLTLSWPALLATAQAVDPTWLWGDVRCTATRDSDENTPEDITKSFMTTVYALLWVSPDEGERLEIGTPVDWTVEIQPDLSSGEAMIDWWFETTEGTTDSDEGEGAGGSSWQQRVWSSVILSENASIEVEAQAIVCELTDPQPGDPSEGFCDTRGVQSVLPAFEVTLSYHNHDPLEAWSQSPDPETLEAHPTDINAHLLYQGQPHAITLVNSDGVGSGAWVVRTFDAPVFDPPSLASTWDVTNTPGGDSATLSVTPKGAGRFTTTAHQVFQGTIPLPDPFPDVSVSLDLGSVPVSVNVQDLRILGASEVDFRDVARDLKHHVNDAVVSAAGESEYQVTFAPNGSGGVTADRTRDCFALYTLNDVPEMTVSLLASPSAGVPTGYELSLQARAQVNQGGTSHTYELTSPTLGAGATLDDLVFTPKAGAVGLTALGTHIVGGSSNDDYTLTVRGNLHPVGESADDHTWATLSSTTHNLLAARGAHGSNPTYQMIAYNACVFGTTSSDELVIANSLLDNLDGIRISDDLVLDAGILTALGATGELHYGTTDHLAPDVRGLLILRTCPDPASPGATIQERSAMCGTWARFFRDLTSIQGVTCPVLGIKLADASQQTPETRWGFFSVTAGGVNRAQPPVQRQTYRHLDVPTHRYPTSAHLNAAQPPTMHDHTYIFYDHGVNILDYDSHTYLFDPSFQLRHGRGGWDLMDLFSGGVPAVSTSWQAMSPADTAEFCNRYFKPATSQMFGNVFFEMGSATLTADIASNTASIPLNVTPGSTSSELIALVDSGDVDNAELTMLNPVSGQWTRGIMGTTARSHQATSTTVHLLTLIPDSYALKPTGGGYAPHHFGIDSSGVDPQDIALELIRPR